MLISGTNETRMIATEQDDVASTAAACAPVIGSIRTSVSGNGMVTA